MNYLKHYNALIDRAKSRQLAGYVERHHVVPKCMGGTNNKNNIVCLTPEEHFLAHQLLVKIYPFENGLAHAAWIMACAKYRKTNKQYGWLRRKHAESISKRLKGIKRGPFSDDHVRKLSKAKIGKTLSDEQKQKIRESVGAYARTDVARQKTSAVHSGKKRSSETRSKISQALAGKQKSAEHVAKFAAAQRGKPQPVVICPHCGKQGGKPIMTRYHFNNCKENLHVAH